MSHTAAEACTQRLAAGRGTGIGLQHVNDDQSAQRDKPLDDSSGEAPILVANNFDKTTRKPLTSNAGGL